MHVAFGRVRRRIARLRTCFSLMRNGYSEMVLLDLEDCPTFEVGVNFT